LAEWPESDGFAKAGALKTTPASSAGMIAFTILLLFIIMSLPFLNCDAVKVSLIHVKAVGTKCAQRSRSTPLNRFS
jgi:hypothetical protein